MVVQPNPVFDETYRHYLSEIGRIDYHAKADLLGVKQDGSALLIPFYDTTYTVSPEGIYDLSGSRTNPAVQVILAKYVLFCDSYSAHDPDSLKTYRDFKGSAPLHTYFKSNTTARIEVYFTGNLERLKEGAEAIGGVVMEADSYDFSVLFYALPRIPVLLNYNDIDDIFPAGCSVLYRESAELFLDMECLAMTGALLAEKLIGAGAERKTAPANS